jgi:dTDP-4-amino-4,6-dideoxygalactose transaminase
MYRYRVTRGMPHWNGAIYRAMVSALAGRNVLDGPAIDLLRRLLIERFDVKDVRLCGSGTAALEIALGACGVRPGDEVIVPAFCCAGVLRPIIALGALPVLADSGPELNVTAANVDAALTRKTRAVIVPHLFGNPADIGAIVELAREKKIRVIDDAAQAVGATVGGRAVGTFGDFGILSFGVEKVVFGLGGGALLCNHEEFSPAGGTLGPASLGSTLVDLLSTVVWWRWRPWTLPLRKQWGWNGSPELCGPPYGYRSERMANLKARIGVLLLRSLEANLRARRTRALAYGELLGDCENLELIRHRQGSACLSQVVRVRSRRHGDDLSLAVIDALDSAGYEVQGSYVPIHRLPEFAGCVWDSLTAIDRIWADLVELPCDPDVSLEDLERIATIVKRAVSSG